MKTKLSILIFFAFVTVIHPASLFSGQNAQEEALIDKIIGLVREHAAIYGTYIRTARQCADKDPVSPTEIVCINQNLRNAAIFSEGLNYQLTKLKERPREKRALIDDLLITAADIKFDFLPPESFSFYVKSILEIQAIAYAKIDFTDELQHAVPEEPYGGADNIYVIQNLYNDILLYSRKYPDLAKRFFAQEELAGLNKRITAIGAELYADVSEYYKPSREINAIAASYPFEEPHLSNIYR